MGNRSTRESNKADKKGTDNASVAVEETSDIKKSPYDLPEDSTQPI